MRIRREMNDCIGFFSTEKLINEISVDNIALYKAVIRTPLNILKVLQVTRIGQLVQINNLIFRVAINHPSHHMRTDKSGAAGNDNFLHFINFQKDYDRAAYLIVLVYTIE